MLFVIYKGKGPYEDLNDHRGVVLLDICSKLCCKLIQTRLAALAEQVCTESELGFRKGRSCTDGTFLLRRLVQEWTCSSPTPGTTERSNLFLLF